MGFQMGSGARLILVTAWSLTMLFYGPILGIAAATTVLLYARAAIGSRPRRTTRRKQPRLFDSVTSIQASRLTVNQWREAVRAGGSVHWTGGP